MRVSLNVIGRSLVQLTKKACWIFLILSLTLPGTQRRHFRCGYLPGVPGGEANIAWSFTVSSAALGAEAGSVGTDWKTDMRLAAERREMESKNLPPEERARLLRYLVEMQKRSEYKAGMKHTRREESYVDYLFEDDIVLTLAQAEEIAADLSRRRKRKLAEPLTKRWTLPIPYTFDGSHSDEERVRIIQALAYWEELTCITFREDPRAPKKLLFIRGSGCWSYVGYTHQVNQTVSIGDGCQSNGTIAHEVGHAIGFWHEQSRPDRDDYILVHRQNVKDGKFYNFQPRTWGEIITLDIPYDLGSDMHYGSKFYARDENSTYTTVETRDPLMTRVIGQRQELSYFDVKLANKAYCEGICSSYGIQLPEPCQRDGYQDPRDCHRCRCPDGFGGTFCETVAPSINAYCGGVLDASYNGTIYSPGYPSPGYHTDAQCSWLITGVPGSHVYLEFQDAFGIACHVDVCKDFVEVRYNSSLALTGARFCCNDPPPRVIRSDTHEMMVLFRSYRESRTCDDLKYPWKCKALFTGFKAKYYTQSCGGCSSRHTPVQAACTRRVSYTCAQTWAEVVKIDCPQWWYTQGCGERTTTKMRYATCHRDEAYCCQGYALQGRTCQDVNHATNDRPIEISQLPTHVPGQTGFPPGGGFPPGRLWTDWGHWSTCSVTCGGGNMLRSRRCVVPSNCGATDVQMDRRPCSQMPCYRKCQVERKVLCDIWKTCTRTVYELCNPFCGSSQLLHGSQCVPAA